MFLDICGAFDNVIIDILLQKLASIGCPSNLIHFIKFLTYERFIFTSVSEECTISYKGVPQGGVLSPLLYILYVSDILKQKPSTVSVSQYADDIALFSKNKNSLQRVIKNLQTELLNLGLELALHKTVFINFNNNNINADNTEININENCAIKSSEPVRFLGIIFDYKMTFNHQTNKVVNRCHRALNIIKYLRGTWWGADPSTPITFYKSFIRSIIEYGCYIYFPTRQNMIEKLEQIQYSAIR